MLSLIDKVIVFIVAFYFLEGCFLILADDRRCGFLNNSMVFYFGVNVSNIITGAILGLWSAYRLKMITPLLSDGLVMGLVLLYIMLIFLCFFMVQKSISMSFSKKDFNKKLGALLLSISITAIFSIVSMIKFIKLLNSI